MFNFREAVIIEETVVDELLMWHLVDLKTTVPLMLVVVDHVGCSRFGLNCKLLVYRLVADFLKFAILHHTVIEVFVEAMYERRHLAPNV